MTQSQLVIMATILGLVLVANHVAANCATQPPVTNPCALVLCRTGTECVVENGQANCVCPSICTQEINEVCGSDGKTYSNPCKLKVHNCNSNTNATKVHSGPCRKSRKSRNCAN